MIQLVEFNDGEPIDMSNCILTPLNYILKNGEDGQFCFAWFFFLPTHTDQKKSKNKNSQRPLGLSTFCSYLGDQICYLFFPAHFPQLLVN